MPGSTRSSGTWLPDARQRFEAEAKQTLCKSVASLKGVLADTLLTTFVVYPSRDDPAGRCDAAVFGGHLGLRRLRPGAVVQITSVSDDREHGPRTLDGAPVNGVQGPFLEAFCSQPPPEVTYQKDPGCVRYLLADVGVGPQHAVDVIAAEVYRDAHPRSVEPAGPSHRYFFANVEQPAKSLCFDVLIHKAVWSRREPELRIYDTTTNGIARPDDPTRDADRLNLAESIQNLGCGAGGLPLRCDSQVRRHGAVCLR